MTRFFVARPYKNGTTYLKEYSDFELVWSNVFEEALIFGSREEAYRVAQSLGLKLKEFRILSL